MGAGLEEMVLVRLPIPVLLWLVRKEGQKRQPVGLVEMLGSWGGWSEGIAMP